MPDHLLCKQDQTLFEAIQTINKDVHGAAFVVDEDGKLKGIVTDGDIRRLILDGVELSDKVGAHISSEFTFAYDSESHQELLAKTSEKIKIIPIVDRDFRFKNFFFYDQKINLPVAAPNLDGNEFRYLIDAFLSTWISSAGEYINRFESEFAQFCNTKHGIATSNGTVAIHLALKALNIGEGDEVIIPDLTFAATINSVLHANATPVIVDVEKESWCISVDEVRKAITPSTKAIIPVHIYGQPCDMDSIMDIANEHNLFVIEDCAEAHGAKFNGQCVGSFGHINCFSFFGNKVITTGEGGMCLTNSDELNDRMRVLRDHGMSKQKRYWHDEVGYNYRMTNLQAAIGVAQLERIEEILINKQTIEDSYKEELNDIDFLHFQQEIAGRDKITWLVCATINDGKRDEYMNTLKEKGIDIRPFFYSLSDMPAFAEYSFSCENSRNISAMGINFPSVKPLEQDASAIIKSVFNG